MEKNMKKNVYVAPVTNTLSMYSKEAQMLVNWSAPDGGGGGGNRPEAKEGLFEEESDCAYNLSRIEYDVWADEEEE